MTHFFASLPLHFLAVVFCAYLAVWLVLHFKRTQIDQWLYNDAGPFQKLSISLCILVFSIFAWVALFVLSWRVCLVMAIVAVIGHRTSLALKKRETARRYNVDVLMG